MDISIVMVNINGRALTEQCIRTIERSGTRCSYEIIIVDNVSTDGSQEWLRQLERSSPHIHCIFNTENRGLGAGNNSALPMCRGRYVLFLNNDTLVLEPLDGLVAAADRLGARCGAVGGRVLNADRSIQYTCNTPYTVPVLISALTLSFLGIRPWFVKRQGLRNWDYTTERDVMVVSGCYIMVPREVLNRVGAFDPNIFLYHEETDLCYRIKRAGYVVRYAPVSAIIHLGGGSTKSRGEGMRWLNQAAWSARYFARNHLGRNRARLLAAAVWMCWAPMWATFATLGLIAPKQRVRLASRTRARYLLQALVALPRQRFPRQSPSRMLPRVKAPVAMFITYMKCALSAHAEAQVVHVAFALAFVLTFILASISSIS